MNATGKHTSIFVAVEEVNKSMRNFRNKNFLFSFLTCGAIYALITIICQIIACNIEQAILQKIALFTRNTSIFFGILAESLIIYVESHD